MKYDATCAATYAATGTNWLSELCGYFVGKENISFALSCIGNYFKMTNGGNMWGQWVSFLSAMRDILGLDLPKLKPYSDIYSSRNEWDTAY